MKNTAKLPGSKNEKKLASFSNIFCEWSTFNENMGHWYSNSFAQFAFGVVAGAGAIVLASRGTEIVSGFYALAERNTGTRVIENVTDFSQNGRETFGNPLERLPPTITNDDMGYSTSEGMLIPPPDVDTDTGLADMLFKIAKDQAQRDCFIHRGITCNMCNASPVCGTRYKCTNCLDYDVCEVCEPGDHHDRTHVFLKIKYPIPPLANPKAMCLKPFYTGMLMACARCCLAGYWMVLGSRTAELVNVTAEILRFSHTR